MIEAVVLGCGTSHGVPMIGCRCAVCLSGDPKNKRTRSGLVLCGPEGNLLVDAPPELRLQLTRERVERVDALLLTHSHADHVMGLDDVRRLNELTGRAMPVFARPPVLDDVRRIFKYGFEPPVQPGLELPSFELREVPDTLEVGGMSVELFDVLHGRLPVLAVKLGGFAYLTDVSEIPPEAWRRLEGLDTLILDATRVAPHPSHFHLERALEVAAGLGAKQTYLTHLSHDYDYAETNRRLPRGVELSFDGLRIEIAP